MKRSGGTQRQPKPSPSSTRRTSPDGNSTPSTRCRRSCVSVTRTSFGFPDVISMRPCAARPPKISRFQEHRLRLLRYLAFGASHYTGDAYGIVSVRDDQHLRRQLSVHSVEKSKTFAAPCSPHDDSPVL